MLASGSRTVATVVTTPLPVRQPPRHRQPARGRPHGAAAQSSTIWIGRTRLMIGTYQPPRPAGAVAQLLRCIRSLRWARNSQVIEQHPARQIRSRTASPTVAERRRVLAPGPPAGSTVPGVLPPTLGEGPAPEVERHPGRAPRGLATTSTACAPRQAGSPVPGRRCGPRPIRPGRGRQVVPSRQRSRGALRVGVPPPVGDRRLGRVVVTARARFARRHRIVVPSGRRRAGS